MERKPHPAVAPEIPEPLLRVHPDCTRITGLCAQSIYNAINAFERGDADGLPAVRFGKTVRVKASSLAAWIESKATGPSAA